jgi:hypothetical protein
MSADLDRIRARLEPLASKHRIAHLAALIRREREGSVRAAQLSALLRALSGAAKRDGRG